VSQERERIRVNVVEHCHLHLYIFHIARSFKTFWTTVALLQIKTHRCLCRFTKKMWDVTITVNQEPEHIHANVGEHYHSHLFIFHIARSFKTFWTTVTLPLIKIHGCLWRFAKKPWHVTIAGRKEQEHTGITVVEYYHLPLCIFLHPRHSEEQSLSALINIHSYLWQLMKELWHAIVTA
jgi:hypothetical protein